MKKAVCLLLIAFQIAPVGVSEASYPHGGMVLIQEVVASSQANVTFTIGGLGINYNYSIYVIEFWGVRPATDSVYLAMDVTSDTVAEPPPDYTYAIAAGNDGGTGTDLHMGSNSDTSAALTPTATATRAGSAANEDIYGWVKIYAAHDTSAYKRWRSVIAYRDKSGIDRAVDSSGTFNDTVALTGFRLFFNSGNINSGTFRIYGMK